MDLGAAFILLIVLAPVVALAAFAILIVDGRPVFFVQRRIGLDGASFRLLKLRTMTRDAERRLDAVLASDPARAEEFDRHMCLRDDPRVLPHIGSRLRRSSIDEVPQLLNVLTGSMSLVGPRPLPASLLDRFPLEHLATRQAVKPGLTGLWQVGGRSANDVSEWIRLDDQYTQSWSLRRDVGILLRTPYALVSRRGAH